MVGGFSIREWGTEVHIRERAGWGLQYQGVGYRGSYQGAGWLRRSYQGAGGLGGFSIREWGIEVHIREREERWTGVAG